MSKKKAKVEDKIKLLVEANLLKMLDPDGGEVDPQLRMSVKLAIDYLKVKAKLEDDFGSGFEENLMEAPDGPGEGEWDVDRKSAAPSPLNALEEEQP